MCYDLLRFSSCSGDLCETCQVSFDIRLVLSIHLPPQTQPTTKPLKPLTTTTKQTNKQTNKQTPQTQVLLVLVRSSSSVYNLIEESMTLCLGLLFNYFPVSFSGFFLEEDRGLMFFFSKSKSLSREARLCLWLRRSHIW